MENVIFIKTNSIKYFKVSKTRKETMEKKTKSFLKNIN